MNAIWSEQKVISSKLRSQEKKAEAPVGLLGIDMLSATLLSVQPSASSERASERDKEGSQERVEKRLSIALKGGRSRERDGERTIGDLASIAGKREKGDSKRLGKLVR